MAAKRILFVDDDEAALSALARNFRRHYEVHVANAASVAMEKLREHGPFAAVVADWHMPNTDGVAFLGEVRKLYPETIRIMLSGDGCRVLRDDAVLAGYLHAFVTKPCRPVDLYLVVESLIGQESSLDQRQ